MKSLFGFSIAIVFGVYAGAADLYFGLGANRSHPSSNEDFHQATSSGVNWQALIGTKNVLDKTSLELDFQQLSFENTSTSSKNLGLSLAYRPDSNQLVQAVFRGGLGATENLVSGGTKATGLGAKLGAGIEYSIPQFVTLTAGVDFRHLGKVADGIATAQAFVASAGFIWPAMKETASMTTTLSQVQKETATTQLVSKDADKDGVSDENDKCPGSPSGSTVNEWGCSLSEKAVIRLNIEFESGKTTVPATGDIEKVALFMKKYADTKVEIAGHTDSLGQRSKNVILSQKRAEAVAAAIVSNGIDSGRVKAVGYGPDKPVSENKTASGRKMNRRVEAQISVGDKE